MSHAVQREEPRPTTAATTAGGGTPQQSPKGVKNDLRGRDFGAQEALLSPSENVQRKAPPGGTGPAAPAEEGAGATPAPAPQVTLDTSSFERWVQSALSGIGVEHGFLAAPLTVDGSLRGPTRTAVRAFQRAAPTVIGRAIGVDGIVGADTTAALEEATSSSAPTVREKDKVEPAPTSGGTTSAPPVADAQGGAPASPGGGAPAPSDEKKAKETTPTVVPGEAPKDAKEKQDLGDGSKADKAAKPGAVRPGQAGKADLLRQKFARGVLVSLTIPAAYDSTEEVMQHVDDGNALDAYAYDQNYPDWAVANAGVMQGYWAAIRAANPKLQKLPENFAGADKKMRGKIIGAVKGNKDNWKQIRCAMWADAGWKQKLATTAYINNKFIPNSAASFAEAQGAVAGNGGDVKIGESMQYNKPAEMGSLVTGTSTSVKALLEANPPAEGSAEDQAAKDDANAKVRFLTISSHGWPTGMGGHGHAKDATFNEKKVPGIIASMAGVLSNDVRVRLFACQTSHVGNGDDSGEGSLADLFRDALLAEGKTDGAVIGHTESGHTQENGTTRFFGGDSEGKKHDDWRGKSIFDGEFARDYLAAIEAPVTKANEGKILDEMRRFFSRECWMGDIESAEALKESSHKMWYERYPDVASVKSWLKDKPKRAKAD